jgi:predicted ester cyclase
VDHTATVSRRLPYNFEAFKGRLYGYRVGMADLHYSIINIVAEGNWIAYQWEMTGTNTGPCLGRPASGNPVRITGMNLERLENGKIVEHWSYPDRLV